MASALGVVCLVLGSLYGLLLLAGPSLSKLLPCHPMNQMMKVGFSTFLGPFFGMPGDLLRILIGAAVGAASAGSLVAIWGEQLGLLGAGGRGTLLDLAQSLTVCAYIGLAWIFLTACWLNATMGDREGVAPTAVLLLVDVALLACRLVVIDVMPLLVGGFTGACVLLLAASLVTRALYGLPTEEAREKLAEFKKQMEAQAAGPGASTEPLAAAEA